MEKLKIVLQSFRATVSRAVKRNRRACVAAAGAAVLLAGFGFAVSSGNIPESGGSIEKTSEGASDVSANEDSPGDEDPDGQIPWGYSGVIEGILSTRGLSKTRDVLGTSGERVLVGQLKIVSEVVTRLDIGQQMVQVSESLENQSIRLASFTRMTDKDYENLLAVVEAEAGGEDVDGRVMVANVILNRVASERFPDDVTSVIWERSGGSAQFSPTEDGRIHSVTVSDMTREAVNRAIDGEDLSQGALYFLARDQSESENVKWFDEKLTFLFDHGGHSFYTEP